MTVQTKQVSVFPEFSVHSTLKSSVSALALASAGALGGCAATGADVTPSLRADGDAHDVRSAMYNTLYDQRGLTEVKGRGHDPTIVAMHATTSLGAQADEVAWCSSAVNWAAESAGTDGTDSPAARSWLNWENSRDVALDEALPGDVIVFWRGSRAGWQGHVGLYAGPGDTPDTVRVLGGNQDDSVSIASYSKARILGVRRAIH